MRIISRVRILGAGALGAAAVSLAAVAGVGSINGAYALTNCTVADVSLDSQEQAFLGLINNYRAQNGLSALTVSTNLNRASTWMGGDMGVKKYFSHTDSLGRSPSKRATDCGYPSGAGENIAAGTVWDTAQEAFDAWKNSPGHNANMLNSMYKQIGIARVQTVGSPYNWYWVTNFGLSNDGTSGSVVAPTSTPVTTPTAVKTATPTPTPIKTATPTATPTKTATPVNTTTATPTPSTSTATVKATMTSPIPGSRLTGTRVTFKWTAGTGAKEYRIDAGTVQGGKDIVSKSTGTIRSAIVSGLPRSRYGTVHVRLWTRFTTGWQYTDYTYIPSR